MAYCTERLLVKYEPDRRTAVTIFCRSWTCERCQPQRRKQLIAQACSGKATTFLTLTSLRTDKQTPHQAARELARAWRLLRLRIMRGKPQRDEYADRCARAVAAGQPKPQRPQCWPFLPGSGLQKLAFIAVFEATKLGWPHLHILLRSKWVSQEWLSKEMTALIGAPVVWIEHIDGGRKIANYVAKYIGKQHHQFGTCKRYWASKDYDLNPKPKRPDAPRLHGGWERDDLSLDRWIAAFTLDGWHVERQSARSAQAARPPP